MKKVIDTEMASGKDEVQTSSVRWILATVFGLPALIIIFTIQILIRIADILMFDTHHIEFTVRPKLTPTHTGNK